MSSFKSGFHSLHTLKKLVQIMPLTLLLPVLLQNPAQVAAQRTALDITFRDLYRPLRLWALNLAGRSGDDLQNVQRVRSLGKTQKFGKRARSLLKFCDARNGPGKRSETPPTSIHRLRPGDIDIIGALGDSLTAGNGIFASNLLHVTVENRGVAFSIGGQDNWQKYLTLPNILKEFNPNLYGYSTKDGLASDRSSKFNVAELGAMSRDIPYEAKILVKRLQHDPLVNMTDHWKLVTLLVGNNDFCSDICYYPNPSDAIKWHERNMVETYRYLRDNVPRLMLNVVPAPNLRLLTRLKGIPLQCETTLRFECPCLVGNGKSKRQLDYLESIIKQWVAKDNEIVERKEFNSETFTINIQPFTQFRDYPQTRDGNSDIRFMSEDCFHLSQRGHAAAANSLWNNMLELPAEKTSYNPIIFERFLCPTKERPYLITRENIKPDFRVNDDGN